MQLHYIITFTMSRKILNVIIDIVMFFVMPVVAIITLIIMLLGASLLWIANKLFKIIPNH